jgi:hypothetical protein
MALLVVRMPTDLFPITCVQNQSINLISIRSYIILDGANLKRAIYYGKGQLDPYLTGERQTDVRD